MPATPVRGRATALPSASVRFALPSPWIGVGEARIDPCHEVAGASDTRFRTRIEDAMQRYRVVWDEALKISGGDPDLHRRDLWNAINTGSFPEWELAVQPGGASGRVSRPSGRFSNPHPR